ncbi:MAG: amino acid permease [Bacteroidetes bacterium]|nr:amino acid permease [Bacteroidota bacterium]
MKKSFGTGPVFFTAISTILGAILFLRFGYAVGTLGFWGVLFVILLGHLVTIPTALAISELATNRKVEGGGEYYIISRSFGLNIGSTIGIALYLSQAISVAFYIIAFTEAFEPLFNWVSENYQINLPRQVISIPSVIALLFLILKKGANLGVKALYYIVAILAISLISFFLGSTEYSTSGVSSIFNEPLRNTENFFIVFAIVFPAFTGMTAGVGLSGDLKNPGKSIPIGTTAATIVGMVVYIFIILKFTGAASAETLLSKQLIMSDIALFGFILVPLGLAASTISSALGSVLVAPRTLQALSVDEALPIKSLNKTFAVGKGETNEPLNATIVTGIIALVFVIIGDVDIVAQIISMFFMVTYGSLCLISFLYHFGSDPSYRPTFKSRWYVSLIGFLLCLYIMVQVSLLYTIIAVCSMALLYLVIEKIHTDRSGLQDIFQNSLYQMIRKSQVFLQKAKKRDQSSNWRPSAVCISQDSFERDKAFKLLSWISYKYGFGTYIHLIEGYYSRVLNEKAKKVLSKLVDQTTKLEENIYVDTLISPSYTSAIAQVAQLPSPSGMENNMIMFEYDKRDTKNLKQIMDNIPLTEAGDFDVCILGSSSRSIKHEGEMHIWLRDTDKENSNLMILLCYIILGHPDWRNGKIKIFKISKKNEKQNDYEAIRHLVISGRLPISEKDIQIIETTGEYKFNDVVNENSSEAGLVVMGFHEGRMKREGEKLFQGFENLGDLLFVRSHKYKHKEIE